MSNWITDLKAKSRTTIKSPISGHEFVIRKLTNTQLMEAGMSAIIAVDEPKQSLIGMAKQADQAIIAQTRYVVSNGCVTPKVTYGDEDKVADGEVHATWISEDERWLFLAILDFSGIANEKAQKELKDYTKNAPGSEALTSSAAGTGDSLTNSSATISDPAKSA